MRTELAKLAAASLATVLSGAVAGAQETERERIAAAEVTRPEREGARDTERLSGSFELVESPQEVQRQIDRAIIDAVSEMSFITRGFARSRLRETNPLRRTMRTEVEGDEVTITYGDITYTTPDGEWRDVRDPSGNQVRLKQTARGDRIEQIFRSEDGEKRTVYRFSEDGAEVTLDVTVTSPQLPEPLRYSLRYGERGGGRGRVAAR